MLHVSRKLYQHFKTKNPNVSENFRLYFIKY